MKKIIYILVLLLLSGCFQEDMDGVKEEPNTERALDLKELEESKVEFDLPLVVYDPVDENKLLKSFDLDNQKEPEIDETKEYRSIRYKDGPIYFLSFPIQYIDLGRNSPVNKYVEMFEKEENLNKELDFLEIEKAVELADSLIKKLDLESYKLSEIYGAERNESVIVLKEYEEQLLDMMDGEMPADYTGPDYEALNDTYIVKYIKEFDDIPMSRNDLFDGQNLLMTYTSQLNVRIDKDGIYYFEARFPNTKTGVKESKVYSEDAIKKVAEHKIKTEMLGFDKLDLSLLGKVFFTKALDQTSLEEIKSGNEEIPLELYFSFRVSNTENDAEETIFINAETGEIKPWAE